MGIRRAVGLRKPAHELTKMAVEHLHGVGVLVVLAVGEVDHGCEVRPVQLVVGRLGKQFGILVGFVVICDDLLRRPQEDLVITFQPLAGTFSA